jgi:hypothetical protein
MQPNKNFDDERQILLFIIDSILRWDKRDLTWTEHRLWLLVRWLVVRLTGGKLKEITHEQK